MLVHENSVVRVDDSVPLDRASLLGCATITGVGAVWHSARIEPGSSVAVIGCGGVGLSVIQGARQAARPGSSRSMWTSEVSIRLFESGRLRQ